MVETPKETGNKLLNKINWKICQINMQQIFYIRKSQFKMQWKKQCFTSISAQIS